MGYIIIAIIYGIVFGFVTQHINENKGYDGGFMWGFFLGIIGVIVVACKPENRSYYSDSTANYALSSYAEEVREKRLIDEGGWKCARCGRVNANYSTSCACGTTMQESKNWKKPKVEEKKLSQADEIKKFKDLLDSGAITQEEYEAKKKQILGL